MQASRVLFEPTYLVFTSGYLETMNHFLGSMMKIIITLLGPSVLVALFIVAEIANGTQFVRITLITPALRFLF